MNAKHCGLLLIAVGLVTGLAVGSGLLEKLARAQDKQKELSPSDVFKEWAAAVAKKDMKTVAKLGSKKDPHRFDGFFEQTLIHYEGKAKTVHEEIDGDRAVVVYRMDNGAGMGVFLPAIKYGMNVLVREEGVWRVTRTAASVPLKVGK